MQVFEAVQLGTRVLLTPLGPHRIVDFKVIPAISRRTFRTLTPAKLD